MTDRTFIIAEMACSHEGNPELAQVIIDGAGRAGADAIQFQIWQLDEIMVPQHPGYVLGQKLEMFPATWQALAEYTRKTWPSLQVIACVNDRPSIDFCESIGVDAYKLHSSDLSNPWIVNYVAATGRRIDLSVGASTPEEIDTALGWIREHGDPEVWMMYGYQGFPTPTDAIHLRFLSWLREHYAVPVGYQDHSDADHEAAFWLPAAAMGLDVDILEKHITHDRAKKGVDHEAALNPEEFIRFVEMVREIDRAKGSREPREFSDEEERYRRYAKKSIVSARDLEAGHPLAEEDLRFMRAEELGLPPDQAGKLLGRKLQRSVGAFELLNEDDLA